MASRVGAVIVVLAVARLLFFSPGLFYRFDQPKFKCLLPENDIKMSYSLMFFQFTCFDLLYEFMP